MARKTAKLPKMMSELTSRSALDLKTILGNIVCSSNKGHGES